MPQLDKFIILNQFKCFAFCFFVVYIIFVVVILPRINLSLRMRKYKLMNVARLAMGWKNLKSTLNLKSSMLVENFSLEKNFLETQFFFVFKNKLNSIITKVLF